MPAGDGDVAPGTDDIVAITVQPRLAGGPDRAVGAGHQDAHHIRLSLPTMPIGKK